MSSFKAWVALIGSIITALLGLEVIPVTGPWHVTLTVASAIVTSVATWLAGPGGPGTVTVVQRTTPAP